ncbi:MAG: hypothetical protein AAF570_00140 [Bacteroidota bacterium]
MSGYAHWLSIDLAHSYFSDEVCRGLQLSPTAETAVTLRKRRILARPHSAGLRLHATQNSAGEWLHLDESYTLCFYMEVTDRDFRAFTDLETRWARGEALCLSSRSNRHQLVAEATYDYVDSAENRVLLRRKQFEFDFGAPLSEAAVVALTDVDGNAYSIFDRLGQAYENNTVPAGAQHFRVDVRAVMEGRFEMAISGGAEHSEAFFTHDLAPGKQPFGVVEIFVDATLTADAEAAPISYTVRFGNRATTWRYRLSADPGADVTLDAGGAADFARTTLDGQVAFVAESALSLQSAYNFRCKLLKDEEYYQDLPYPAPTGFLPDAEGQHISEMFVQV